MAAGRATRQSSAVVGCWPFAQAESGRAAAWSSSRPGPVVGDFCGRRGRGDCRMASRRILVDVFRLEFCYGCGCHARLKECVLAVECTVRVWSSRKSSAHTGGHGDFMCLWTLIVVLGMHCCMHGVAVSAVDRLQKRPAGAHDDVQTGIDTTVNKEE